MGYPALIERERWERTHALIVDTTPVAVLRRKGGPPTTTADNMLLRGIGFCPEVRCADVCALG
jgi:hypothetical protein